MENRPVIHPKNALPLIHERRRSERLVFSKRRWRPDTPFLATLHVRNLQLCLAESRMEDQSVDDYRHSHPSRLARFVVQLPEYVGYKAAEGAAHWMACRQYRFCSVYAQLKSVSKSFDSPCWDAGAV